MIQQYLAAVAVAPVMAIATYLRGRPKGWKWLPIGAVMLGVLALFVGWPAWLLAVQIPLCWLAWRGWAWDGWGGKVMTPRTTSDYLHVIARQAAASVFVWPFWSVRGWAVLCLSAWLIGEVVVAAWRTYRRDHQGIDVGEDVEWIQGWTLGVVVAGLMLMLVRNAAVG